MRSYNSVADRTGELLRSIKARTKVASVPDNVLSALPDLTLSNEAFADGGRRTLPIHTKEAVLASASYYYHNPNRAVEYPGGNNEHVLIDTTLKTAASVYGVSDELQQIEKAAHDMQTPGEDECIPGTEIPYRTSHEVSNGVAHLRKFASVYLPVDRQKIAAALLTKATHLPESDVDYLQRLAGQGMSRWSKVAHALEVVAAQLTIDSKHDAAKFVDTYAKTAATMSQSESGYVDSEVVFKIAAEVDAAARVATGRGIATDTFIEQTPMSVARYMYDHVKLANQCVVKYADFAKQNLPDMASVVGVETGAELLRQSPAGREKLAALSAAQANALCDRLNITPTERPLSLDLKSLLV